MIYVFFPSMKMQTLSRSRHLKSPWGKGMGWMGSLGGKDQELRIQEWWGGFSFRWVSDKSQTTTWENILESVAIFLRGTWYTWVSGVSSWGNY